MEGGNELGGSQTLMPFPVYRRSHFRSNTYRFLVHLFSHLPPSTASLQASIEPLSVPDNGNGTMGEANQEIEPQCSEFVSSNCMDPKDPVLQKEIQKVHERVEGDKDAGFSFDKRVLDDIDLMWGTEETSTQENIPQENILDKERLLMDELELFMKETKELVCDEGSTPLSSGFDEKQNSGSDPLASDGFDLSSMVDVSSSTERQASAMENNPCSSKPKTQEKETKLVETVHAEMGSLPTIVEGEFEKKEHGQKVSDGMHFSFDVDMNSESFNASEGGIFPDSAILKDNQEVQDGREKFEKIICGNDAANSSNILIEKGDMEEGEISGDMDEGEISRDMRMNGYSSDMHSSDALMLQKVGEVQKPECVTGNMVHPSRIGNGEREKSQESNLFMVTALQDVNNCKQAEPRTGGEKRIAFGDEVAICRKDRHLEFKGINELRTNLTQNQVLQRGFLEESASKDHGNSSAVKLVDATGKRKLGPASEEKENKEMQVDARKMKKRGPVSDKRKEKKKEKKRKKRAQKNREQGVKRLKLQPVQKPKIVSHCRHYLMGRCHEGDKCHFSHDVVPLTKSKPCVHYARHSCMKGDDCPFDHQLSNHPCNNFVSKGSCSRGDACLFSHKVRTNLDFPAPSNVAELKSPTPSRNANFSTPLNNHGSSSVQQKHHAISAGIHSHTNAKYRVTDAEKRQPTPPKGISFINFPQLTPSNSALKQGTITTTRESPVQIGAQADQTAFGTTQNKVKIPNKLPAVTPKGINFLSFGKGSICSFKSPIPSHVNKENGIRLPQLPNFGSPELVGLSLTKDDYSKVSDRTKHNVPQTGLLSNETSNKNQSVAEGMKLKFVPGTTSVDVSTRDHHHKSVQEGKNPCDNSQASNVNSAQLLVRPFVSNQPSELLISGYDKHASNSSQRALLSTLAFAAEHESDIKLKYPIGA